MLKKIRIQNFKSLENFEIELKPLMLLFGKNSSGKSTFLKALMFLKQNLFPLNTEKTKFFINKNVNLISYEDIVTNNDTSKDIIYEFYFEGKYKFFNLNSISKEFYKSEEFLNSAKQKTFLNLPTNNEADINDFINSLETFDELGVFEFYSKYIQNNFLNDNAIDLLKTNYDCNYKLQLIFSKELNRSGYHFKNINFFDNMNENFIKFNFEFDEFVLNDIHLANIDFLTEILKFNKDYKYNLFDFPSIPSLEKLKSNNIDITNKIYLETIKLLYCSYMLLPKILKSFFTYLHLPSLREIPESIYLLEKKDDNKISNQYYGLLVELASEQVKLQNLFSNLFKESSPYSVIENIVGLILKLRNNAATNDEINLLHYYTEQYYKSNPELENAHTSSLSFFDNEFKIVQQTPDKFKEARLKEFTNNLIFKINIDLKKIGLNDYFLILYSSQFETAKMFSITKPGTEVYLSNSSSGLIQLLPLICFLNIFNSEGFKYSHTFDSFVEYIMTKELLYDLDEFSYNTVLIEQPELHLHPRLQCKIAELICENVMIYNSDTSMIIETHSEHIIKKIQIEIAKGSFNRNLINVYYFDKKEGKTNIKKMEIEDNGFFKEPWPDGFFDDSYNLSWELLGASRKN